MHFDFKGIFGNVSKRLPDEIKFEADGVSYIRRFRPQERLIILGAGHISQSLCNFAVELGFSVIVVDDRASFANVTRFPRAERVICDSFENAIKIIDIDEGDYVAVVTRGHRYDADCLREVLSGKMPVYLGLIGSRRRTVELLNMLEREGFERKRLDMIHTPIGLEIGALTVPEIAVSIAAELVKCRRQKTDRRSKSTLLVCEDADLNLLSFLAENNEPAALVIVYASSGSTPAKPGSMMAVDKNLRTWGTIGGGCSEGAVMLTARKTIGTGGSLCTEIDMSNDVAESEGMVCGGRMKVLITDIT